MAYLTFHKWLVSVCNIHNAILMVKTKTRHLGKVSYAIILLGWRYFNKGFVIYGIAHSYEAPLCAYGNLLWGVSGSDLDPIF